MVLLKFTQHLQILMSPHWLGSHHSCKLRNTDFPSTTPKSLVTSAQQRCSRIFSLHTAEPHLILSFPQPPLTSLCTTLHPTLSGVTVNSVDPGIVYTGIMKNFSWTYRVLFWLSSFFIKVGRGGSGSSLRGWSRTLLLSLSCTS